MKKPPVQWNCEGCDDSGLLAPPQEPILVQDGEIEVPEVGKDGSPVFEMIDGKDDAGKPIKIQKIKTKKQPRMVHKKRKMLRQEPVTGVMHEIEVPEMKDLCDRIYLTQLRVGEEIITRYLCGCCLKKLIPLLKPAKEMMLGMNQ